MWTKNYRQRREAGCCVRCGVHTGGKVNCPTCWEKFLAKRREREATRKKHGVCTLCRNQALPGRFRCERHNNRNNSQARAHRVRLKWIVLQAYGGAKCACCGEKTFEFLTIDHINGGGRQHLKQIRTNLYDWLRRHSFPSGYQVLCFNCNTGRHIAGGICPHEKAKMAALAVPAVDDAEQEKGKTHEFSKT